MVDTTTGPVKTSVRIPVVRSPRSTVRSSALLDRDVRDDSDFIVGTIFEVGVDADVRVIARRLIACIEIDGVTVLVKRGARFEQGVRDLQVAFAFLLQPRASVDGDRHKNCRESRQQDDREEPFMILSYRE